MTTGARILLAGILTMAAVLTIAAAIIAAAPYLAIGLVGVFILWVAIMGEEDPRDEPKDELYQDTPHKRLGK